MRRGGHLKLAAGGAKTRMARHGTLGNVGRSGGPRVVVRAWLGVVAVLFLHASGAGPASASAESDEAGVLALVNQERAARGMGPLAPAPDLVTVARRHSARMAEANEVFHNSRLASEVDGWDLLGENVGVGPDVQKIHDALMASKVHRDVILEPRFTQIGVGVVIAGGEIWLTEVFRLPETAPRSSPAPTGQANAPPAPPAPQAATEPAAPAGPGAGTGGAGGPVAASGRAPATPKLSVAPVPVRGPATTFGRLQIAGRRPAPPTASTAPPPAASPETAQLAAEPVLTGTARPAAASVPLPEPEDIPAAGLMAAGLLLAVVGSASVTTRRAPTDRLS